MSDETRPANSVRNGGEAATQAPAERASALYTQVDQQAIAAAEQQVGAEWQAGDAILDLYDVTALLGEGGMGRVYKVHHRGWNVDLAVKSPRPEIFATAGGKQNFVREAETWVNLGLHPHTVSCYYVRTLGGIPRVFAGYVEGGSLADWIRTKKLYEGGPEKALERILDIAIQFAWGLHYAHEQGLVHQDVKPANVMMTADGVAKVTDFGLAKARGMAGEAQAAALGAPAGGGAAATAAAGRSILVSVGGMTPAYCSPEQARGELLSRKTDIWSWAVSVLEMFTGEVTWLAGQAAPEALEGYLAMPGNDPNLPAMPAAVAELLRCCFDGAAQRPRDLGQVASTLMKEYVKAAGSEYRRRPPQAAELTADGWNNRALSYLDLSKEQEARHAWQTALRSDPQHPETTYNEGLWLWRRGECNDEDLIAKLSAVQKTHGNRWQAGYLLALVQLEHGDADYATDLLQQALGQVPGDPEVESVLALARSGRVTPWRTLRILEGHAEQIHAVALSADLRLAFTGGYDKTSRLWDLSSGQCRAAFDHGDIVYAACLTPDGAYAVAGDAKGNVVVIDTATNECVRVTKAHEGQIRCIALSPDGRQLATGGTDGRLNVSDLVSGRYLTGLHLGHTPNGVCFTGAGQRVLVASDDHMVRVWDVNSNQRPRVLEGHTSSAKTVAASEGGSRAVSGGQDETLRVWDVETGQCIRVLRGHTSHIQAVAMSPDGERVVSAGWDSAIRLWETATGRCLCTMRGHRGFVDAVALSADGRSVLSGGNPVAVLMVLPEPAAPQPFRVSRVQQHAQVLEAEQRARRALAGAQQALSGGRHRAALESLRNARSVPGWERAPEALDLWAHVARGCRRTALRSAWLAATFGDTTESLSCLALTPDNTCVLAAGWDHKLRVWELTAQRCLKTLDLGALADSLALTPNGRLLVHRGRYDKAINVIDMQTGARVHELKADKAENDRAFCVTPDSRYLLSAGGDRQLRFWDLEKGRLARPWNDFHEFATGMCVSRDGRTILSCGGKRPMRLWELDTGRCIRTFEPHEAFMESVAMSGDARWAISAHIDETPCVWEVSTGRRARVLAGHASVVHSVCLSLDGRWALSGDDEGVVRVWDVATGKNVQTLNGHTDRVAAIVLTPDARLAITAGHDKTVRVWLLDWELEAPEPADWDDGATPWLEAFLCLHAPASSRLSTLLGRKNPSWSEADFQRLLDDLACVGYGWLRPEGVRRKLEEMAANLQGPPPLPNEAKSAR